MRRNEKRPHATPQPRLARLSERTFRWLIHAVTWGPLLITGLAILEWACLWGISEPKIFGLDWPSWLLADVIHRGETGPRETSVYSTAIYNGLGFLGDRNKLLPYIAVCLWLIVVPPLLADALGRIPRAALRGVLVVGASLFIVSVLIYDLTMLVGNRHEHWFGTTRKGLFAALDWFGEPPEARPTISSLLSLIGYRLSYTVHTTFLFLVGTFTATVVLAGARYDSGTQTVRDTLAELVHAKTWERWSRQKVDQKPGQQLSGAVLNVTGVVLGAMLAWVEIARRSDVTIAQNAVAMLIVAIGVVPLIIYAKRRGASLAGFVFGLGTASVLAGVFVIPGGKTAIAEEVYKGVFVSVNRAEAIRRKSAAVAITGLSTAHMNSASVMEEARRWWVTENDLAARETNPWKRALQDRADQTLVLVWLAQLKRLEALSTSLTEAEAPVEAIREAEEGVRSFILRPADLDGQRMRYSWRDDVTRSRSAAWRWWSDMARQVARGKEAIQGVAEEVRLTTSESASGLVGGEDPEWAAISADCDSVLKAYLATPLGEARHLDAHTQFGQRLGEFVCRVDRNSIWLSNLALWRRNVVKRESEQ